MSQANDTPITTPADAPAGSAVPIKSYNGVTRSQIMKRAWQLAKLNKGKSSSTGREQIGLWISHAWKEAREGRTDNWTFLSPEHEARCIEHQLVVLQNDDRRSPAHYTLMASLRASVNALRAVGAAR